MQSNSIKTYAWRIEMHNSKPVRTTNNKAGIKYKRLKIPPIESIDQANPAIIFNKVWPDVIFANNRMAKVNTFTL